MKMSLFALLRLGKCKFEQLHATACSGCLLNFTLYNKIDDINLDS